MEKIDLLENKCIGDCFNKLVVLNNEYLLNFIFEYVHLCNPKEIFVSTDSSEDISYIRENALKKGEEIEAAIKGHTVHFDGYYDQARDKEKTKYLLPEGVDLGPYINSIAKKQGCDEIRNILKDIMREHTLYIQFFCLGPTDSEFSLPAVQLTDSAYVAHSQNILYRQGYREFKKLGNSSKFFKFVHSQGELENNISKNISKRRVYIDLENDIVFSANTQYGGNTIGHKKLAMRLAINRASEEHWLTEHMFLMKVHGPRGRKTYFTGAFPSLCGKTSTSMIKGESIIGDDIVYMRVKEGKIRAVNVEKGMFGIIKGINSKDDAILWKVLNSPGEIIFSNVLLTEDKNVCWVGKDGDMPDKGINHSGKWYKGKKDKEGNEIPASHPNARLTLDLEYLDNFDSKRDDPDGVEVGGIIYGGRDSDTWVPVEQSFDWTHGIITKAASLESETTAAALGETGIRQFNPMANLAFVSIPLGKYIENNIKFGTNIENPPLIFSVNYFLRNSEGKFLNEVEDKAVWLKWMELRVYNDVDAIKTPTGYIPEYQSLKKLFRQVLNKEYLEEDYIKQFTLRIPENLAKIDRIINIYKTKVDDTPKILFRLLEEQKQKLQKAREEYKDYIRPVDY